MKSSKVRVAIKNILPDSLIRYLSGFFYGWYGDFSSWEQAQKLCTGYNSSEILDKVQSSAIKIRDKRAVYERDSMIFDEIQYSFPLLAGIMWVAAQNNGKINVLDFGGSLGSSYYQNKSFLDSLKEVNWCIVEQPALVKTGRESFSDDRLHFFYSAEECFESFKIDTVLFSSVLQYLEKPYELLTWVINERPDVIIIDRTPFISSKDRLTIQKVNPGIYKASYPCWFFNKKEFIDRFKGTYKLTIEFKALDRANIDSEFLGFIFNRIHE